MELLMGCGFRSKKDIVLPGMDKDFKELVRLDNNPDCKPDVLHDLQVLPLPFAPDTFDEIHAYDVLEHIAWQGNCKFFFTEFAEYWRILKPGGLFLASVPKPDSPWAWGDPGHSRIISRETLYFLTQSNYEEVGKTRMTDYRGSCNYKADFQIIGQQTTDFGFYFALKAIK